MLLRQSSVKYSVSDALTLLPLKDFALYDTKEISNTNPSIDLGAVAKGYATKKVAELLKKREQINYLIQKQTLL